MNAEPPKVMDRRLMDLRVAWKRRRGIRAGYIGV